MVGDKFEETKNSLKKYAEEMNLSKDTINIGYILLDDFKKRDGDDFKPENMAAGVLYMSAMLAGERKTQENIGKVAKISATTVCSNYKNFVTALTCPLCFNPFWT